MYNVAISSSCRIQYFRFYDIPVQPLHQSPLPGFLPLGSRINLLCNHSQPACLEAVLWYMQWHSRDRWPSPGLQPRCWRSTNPKGSNLKCIISIQKLLYVKLDSKLRVKTVLTIVIQEIGSIQYPIWLLWNVSCSRFRDSSFTVGVQHFHSVAVTCKFFFISTYMPLD